jgi:DNA transformation protein and related proteins
MSDFLPYALDQLKPFGRVVSRRMFGGVGLYSDGLFFGLISDDTLYLKVDDTNRGDYTSRGCKPFRPFADDTYTMSYFELPADVLENPDELKDWARKALRVAAASAAAKKSPARKAVSTGTRRARRKKSARKSK